MVKIMFWHKKGFPKVKEVSNLEYFQKGVKGIISVKESKRMLVYKDGIITSGYLRVIEDKKEVQRFWYYADHRDQPLGKIDYWAYIK